MAKKKKKKSSGGGKRGGRGIMGAVFRGAVSAGIGGAAFYAQRWLSEQSETMRENWYAGPLVTFAAGAFLMSRSNSTAKQIGASLATAAGYSGAMAYNLTESGQEAGAVFEPMARIPQVVDVEPEPMPVLPEAAPEAGAVYPPMGPHNRYARAGGRFGSIAA